MTHLVAVHRRHRRLDRDLRETFSCLGLYRLEFQAGQGKTLKLKKNKGRWFKAALVVLGPVELQSTDRMVKLDSPILSDQTLELQPIRVPGRR